MGKFLPYEYTFPVESNSKVRQFKGEVFNWSWDDTTAKYLSDHRHPEIEALEEMTFRELDPVKHAIVYTKAQLDLRTRKDLEIIAEKFGLTNLKKKYPLKGGLITAILKAQKK